MIIWFVIFDFLFGIFLVWFYAAIRPRFGAGPRTAVLAGFAIWVLYGLLHAIGEAPMGLFPLRLAVIGCIVAPAEYVGAGGIGAKYYTEMQRDRMPAPEPAPGAAVGRVAPVSAAGRPPLTP